MEIYKTWSELKTFITEKILKLQYIEYEYKYEIFVEFNNNLFIKEIWKDTTKVKGIDETQNNLDKTDFETNYKSECNECADARNEYKSDTIEITNYDTWMEYDLGKTYKAFTLMVQGDNDIIIKLNDTNNNEIPLQGTKIGKDVIDADPFNLSKVYYKLKESGKVSKMTVWAIG